MGPDAIEPPTGRVPLRERVYEALEELIIYGTLAPGEHLVEADLADMLGVSRIPVREALALLSRDGWVELRPRQGAFVHRPTLNEVDEVFAVRALLEAEAARLAAKNAGDADIGNLNRLLERGRAAHQGGEEREIVRANSEFHRCVAEIAGNHVLVRLTSWLDTRIRWYFAQVARARSDASYKEHVELVDAIRARDPEWAAEVTLRHLNMTKSAYHELKPDGPMPRD
jgi:DNA-binding GntR family transcriptional regulator